jgi:hypothetical protein
MKRRGLRERDEAAGREQAERRLKDLLGKVRAREAAARRPQDEPAPEGLPTPDGMTGPEPSANPLSEPE